MKLSFELADGGSPRTLDFEARRLVIAGWTGRDPVARDKHIAELEAIGIARPINDLKDFAINRHKEHGPIQAG